MLPTLQHRPWAHSLGFNIYLDDLHVHVDRNMDTNTINTTVSYGVTPAPVDTSGLAGIFNSFSATDPKNQQSVPATNLMANELSATPGALLTCLQFVMSGSTLSLDVATAPLTASSSSGALTWGASAYSPPPATGNAIPFQFLSLSPVILPAG